MLARLTIPNKIPKVSSNSIFRILHPTTYLMKIKMWNLLRGQDIYVVEFVNG